MQNLNKPVGHGPAQSGTDDPMTGAPSAGSALRERAEDVARLQPPLPSVHQENLSPEIIRKTLHELQVHQIELQMQNEELQTAQVVLDKARARYFELYDLAPVGYCTVSEQGLVTEANLASATLLGLSRMYIVGQPISRFIAHAHQDRYYLHRKQVMSTGNAHACELQLVKNDRQPFWVEMTTTTAREDNGAWVLRLVLSDITARKKMDQLLEEKNTALERARRIADKSNQAKSDFLSSMSHELRTPLNAILGFAQLIDTGTPAPTPTQKTSVDQILHAGWYLLDLVNEILDLALVESGKLSVALQPMALADVMLECQAMIKPQADKRDISMHFAALAAPFLVLADSTRFKQVLINLLSNAVKYNKPGGTVVMTCTETAGGRVRMGIKDTGEGLSPERIAQLFQPFNRLGQESRAEQGTGIGLVMTKRLVELMGGTIGVDSVLGAGSSFWVEMSLITGQAQIAAQMQMQMQTRTQGQASAAVPVKKAALPENDSRKSNVRLHTLLYIEDDSANLLLIESLMGHRPDVHLLSASDGSQGLAVAQARLPDVILTDMHLPDIPGIELLKKLQGDPATAHIPVIALGPHAKGSDIDSDPAAGFYRYLAKPIKIDVFMATLDEALMWATTRADCIAGDNGSTAP